MTADRQDLRGLVEDALSPALSVRKQDILRFRVVKAVPALLDRLDALERVQEDSMGSLQREQWEWSSRLFPGQSEQSMIEHIRDEANRELTPGCDPHELADVGLILMALASRRGIDLHKVMREKLEIIKRRKWDRSGAFPRHIPALDSTGGSDEATQ